MHPRIQKKGCTTFVVSCPNTTSILTWPVQNELHDQTRISCVENHIRTKAVHIDCCLHDFSNACNRRKPNLLQLPVLCTRPCFRFVAARMIDYLFCYELGTVCEGPFSIEASNDRDPPAKQYRVSDRTAHAVRRFHFTMTKSTHSSHRQTTCLLPSI